MMPTWPQPNMIYGTGSVPSDTASVTSSHFFHFQDTAHGNMTMGYSAGAGVATVTNNYFVGSSTALQVTSAVGVASVTGNKFYTSQGFNVLSGARGYTWNNNAYYTTASNQHKYSNESTVTNQIFADWKASTGYDASSTISTSALPDEVIVRPNIYDIGRANIIVYAFSGATSANVDLSTTGLTNGKAYTIKNAFNWYGPDVAAGIYNSSSPTISVPLSTAAATVATPIGHNRTPATTAPKFVLLVVLPR